MNYSYHSLGIAMVKNEADIIEAFVRHNIAYLDVLVVIENGSVDSTRDILLALQSEGLPIVIFDDPIVGYFQAEKVTAAYRKAVPVFQPRFVFLLDADEFIVTPSREHLQAQLQRLRPGTQGRYFWRTYVPSPAGENQTQPTGDPLRDIVFRRKSERLWPKSIVATHDAIDTKVAIQQGGHDVWLQNKPLPAQQLENVALAHFPIRSVEQLTTKALLGWVAYLVRNRTNPMQGAGLQWRLLYEKIVDGGLTEWELAEQALRYAQDNNDAACWPNDVVHDPLLPQYSALTVRAKRKPSPLQMFVRSTESLLTNNPRSMADYLQPAAEGKSLFAKGRALLAKAKHALANKSGAGNAASVGRHDASLCLDVPPLKHLAERHRPSSVLELGCGSGAHLQFFAAQGAQCILGVDGFYMRSGYLQPDEYLQHDLDKNLQLGRQFSLVVCFAETRHLSAAAEQVLLDNIARHASERIVFSAVRPRQSSAGRTDSHPIDYWLEQFAARGWYVDAFDTLAIRSLATFTCFRSNMMALTKLHRQQETIRQILRDTEKRPVQRQREASGIVAHPFASLERDLLAATGHDERRRI